MSVVNKMLQDLEARQSQTAEINSDYQPPEKKQSKLLVYFLLILSIATITYILLNNTSISDIVKESQNSDKAPPAPIQIKNQPKKMQVAVKKPAMNSESSAESHISQQDSVDQSQAVTEAEITEIQGKSEIPPPSDVEKSGDMAEAFVGQGTEINNIPIPHAESQEDSSTFTMVDSHPTNQSISLKQRISESLKAGDNTLSASLLSQLLKVDPENIQARKRLASLHFGQGNYTQTKLLLVDGIEKHPQQADLKLMLARLYVVQNETENAMALLLEFEPNKINQVEYLAYRAALAQKLTHTDLAKKDYQTLTQSEPNNGKWWLGLAVAEDQLGNGPYALQAYKKAQSTQQLEAAVNKFIQQRILVLAGTQ